MILIGPQLAQKYRVNTAKAGIVFTATQRCQGPCHLARSVAQFALGDVLCKQCRRHA